MNFQQTQHPPNDQSSLINELQEAVAQHEKSATDAESLLRDSNFKLAQAEYQVKELTSSLVSFQFFLVLDKRNLSGCTLQINPFLSALFLLLNADSG